MMYMEMGSFFGEEMLGQETVATANTCDCISEYLKFINAAIARFRRFTKTYDDVTGSVPHTDINLFDMMR